MLEFLHVSIFKNYSTILKVWKNLNRLLNNVKTNNFNLIKNSKWKRAKH